MSEFSRIFLIARTDFSYFFRTKWLMAILISLNLSDMLVTGLVYNGLVQLPIPGASGSARGNYFTFLIPGIITMGLFTAATDTGRRIWLALREGMVQYYLTLPVRTGGLVGAYIVSGGLGGLVYSLSLLAVASILLPPQGLVNVLILLPLMFVLATGIAGLAAFLASLSRQGEVYWAYAQSLQVFMVTFSTIFYPSEAIAQFLPGPLAAVADANPLSIATRALRESAFGTAPLTAGVLTSLFAASIPFAVLGAVSYWIILRTIRTRGKP